MSLLRSIPTKNTMADHPFLHEVDFTSLQERMVAASLTTPLGNQQEQGAVGNGAMSRIVEPALPLSRLCLPLASSGINSVWIMGEKGIGKSTLVETMLRARAERRLDQHFLAKRFYIFDVNEFFDCKEKGGLTQNFRDSMDIATQNNGLVIFDNFDDFVLMAKHDAGCLVSALVSRLEKHPELQAILISEHDRKKMIEETSTGISRRFVELNLTRQPTPEEMRSILLAHFVKLEAVHDVNFTDEAADEIIRLLTRFPGQAFAGSRPSNAINFADYVAAHVRMNIYAMPPEIAEMREKLGRMKDQYAILLGDGPDEREEINRIEAQIKSLAVVYNAEKTNWENKVNPVLAAHDKFARTQGQIELLAAKGRDRTKNENDTYDVLCQAIARARDDLQQAEVTLYPDPPRVTAKHVQAVFNDQAGLPFEFMNEDQDARLQKLEGYLDGEIFLQSEAKKALARIYKAREKGVSDPDGPAGVILLAGGTALGKTELAEVLARFDGGEHMRPISIRLSEYKGKGAVSRLTGADPGTIGYDRGSPKLEEILLNPRAVVLFDELDKADPSVFDVLMQILDKGELTLSNGKLLDFKNAIIILTTNAITADDFSPEVLSDQRAHQDVIRDKLKEARSKDTQEILFRHEFVRRFRQIYVLEKLGPEQYVKILHKKIRGINRSFAPRGLGIELDQETAEHLIAHYDISSMGGSGPGWIAENIIRAPLVDYLTDSMPAQKEKAKGLLKMKVVFEGSDVHFEPCDTNPVRTEVPPAGPDGLQHLRVA